MLTWEKYDINKHREVDLWNAANEDIDKFAMFEEPLSITNEWYEHNKMGKICDKILIAKDKDIIVGFVILNISIINTNLCIGINPIVANPNYNGYGEKMLKELIQNYNSILNIEQKDVIFTAGISESNIKSKHLFLKLGFIQTGLHEDKTFGYYRLSCKKIK